MLQVAIIGLGSFGIRMLEELNQINAEIIILDKNREVIEQYKSQARDAFITDAIKEEVLQKVIPPDIDCVIVDVGSKIEVSMMATNYLHKMGIKKIITKAESDEHGELLKLVGATRVVFPDYEAAKRITPLLASSAMFNYLQVAPGLALAEIRVQESLVGKTLMESNLRQAFGLNLVAYRSDDQQDFSFVTNANFQFTEHQVLLVAGTEDAIASFANDEIVQKTNAITAIFQRLFPRKDVKK